MNSNKHDDRVRGAQNNGSSPSMPDDSPLCPASLDAVHPPITPRSPTEEPALDSEPPRVHFGDEIVEGDAADDNRPIALKAMGRHQIQMMKAKSLPKMRWLMVRLPERQLRKGPGKLWTLK